MAHPLLLLNTIIGIETHVKFLAVGLGVGAEQLAGGGTLESLEARFALDGLSGVVLRLCQ